MGGVLAEALLRRGHSLATASRSVSKIPKRENVQPIEISLDIADKSLSAVRRFKPDAVVHLAATDPVTSTVPEATVCAPAGAAMAMAEMAQPRRTSFFITLPFPGPIGQTVGMLVLPAPVSSGRSENRYRQRVGIIAADQHVGTRICRGIDPNVGTGRVDRRVVEPESGAAVCRAAK